MSAVSLVKVAPMVLLLSIVRVSGLSVPVLAPVHALKIYPVDGVAVTVVEAPNL